MSKNLPKFKNLQDKVSDSLIQAVKGMGFKRMTEVQSRVIPIALEGNDLVVTAKTGSGKTLAFLIPVTQLILNTSTEKQTTDTMCVIISPTRELAIQTDSVLQSLTTRDSWITSALAIGGESKKKQITKLSKGAHIVVATPGRLFDHMRSKYFDYSKVKYVILDEADKMFQYGFEEDLKQIISRLPEDRQTMLFSATRSERTEALIKSAMKAPVEINFGGDDANATVEGLKQGYVVVETEKRMCWLHKLLKKTRKQKVMVFFSSCKSVEYHHSFFTRYCKWPLLCIHGKMSQSDRNMTMNEFYSSKSETLFCTDVAARGLDIPAVDWIVQFDPSGDANEYIHRVGRTARGLGAVGNAVLLLRPEETDFVKYLNEFKIYLDKYETWDRFVDLQPMLDEALAEPTMLQLAIDAYEGYIRAFEVKKLKHIFNIMTLDLESLARSFGLKRKPDIDIRSGFKKKYRPRKREAGILAAKSGLVTKKHKT